MYDYSLLPNRHILCVDLQSFYASVSCVKMGLDPLHTKLAVVGDVNRQGSIVLAATPPLKDLGVKKMRRLYEIPRQPDILIVNPIMETYIKCSNYITKLALQYVAIEDFHQYSIDEFFMDVTASLHLFADHPYEFALNFKREIYKHTRIHSTIGIGPNLLMSKVALDIEAKKTKNGIAYWVYNDVPEKLWPIRPLSKFWGISHRTEAKLNRKGIATIGDLAHYPLRYLKESFGVIGEELHLHSNGIDLSRISEKYVQHETSICKSQILLRDYEIHEVQPILLEHTEEVCYRLRSKHKLARTIQFSIGYSKDSPGGFKKSCTLDRPTNLTLDIYRVCLRLLKQLHTGEPIRTVSIGLTNLVNEGEEQISLFDDIYAREREIILAKTMDEIRTRFGKNSILRGVSYSPNATGRYRNTLIGGHKG
ncbi:Y-family DNA polymerase [Bacillus sp. UNC322MFChir4.1]|uniref:Y-family DNA polymerase n=1 Tax=Bacillus sp. UNC322MFChir4.1 TaxID=1449045 RepID=UPI00054CE7B9|nr:Y-family DNA polymerase [Bacillus sp. UNC322MFChir4.1]